MQTGLHIFSPNYARACWLEGDITEQGTGAPIFGASIQILNTNRSAASDLDGFYATGTAQAGTYNVQILKAGYLPANATVVLQNDSLTILDVALVPATPFGYSGTVVEAGSNQPIQGARVQLRSYNGVYNFSTTTNASGNFSFPTFYAENYEITVGHWGHHTQQFPQTTISASSSPLTVALMVGYRDEFVLDFGWQVSGDANPEGFWTRATPIAVNNAQNLQITPAADLSTDIGEFCYVTGNDETGQVGAADVDNGTTTLLSPAMDLLAYQNPVLQFSYWFVNESGTMPMDSLQILAINGSQTVTIASYGGSNRTWSPTQSYRLMDYLPMSNNVRIAFVAHDLNNPNLVEAAVDMFEIAEQPIAVENLLAENAPSLLLSPNPSSQYVRISTSDDSAVPSLRLHDALGRVVYTYQQDGSNAVHIDLSHLPAALYWLVPSTGKAVAVQKSE